MANTNHVHEPAPKYLVSGTPPHGKPNVENRAKPQATALFISTYFSFSAFGRRMAPDAIMIIITYAAKANTIILFKSFRNNKVKLASTGG